MRLPEDPAKLKLLTREHIIKHCRTLEKKANAFKKQLEELVETMPEALDKKYEYRDVNGLKQIRLYEFLPNLRTWKKKLEELLASMERDK